MKPGQYLTPACIAQQTNISFTGVIELLEKLKLRPAFSLNNTDYFDVAAVRKIDDAAREADLSTVSRGVMIKAAAEPAIVPLVATAELTIEAAADGKPAKRPTFSISAYSGGLLRVAGYYTPMVVDLAGLRAGPGGRVTILKDHDTSQIVGQGTASITASAVTVNGVITGNINDPKSPAGEVVDQSKNGFVWAASVGVAPERVESVAPGAKIKVNGQEFTGPVGIVRAGRLGEVSFVGVGADETAIAKIAASAARKPMSNEFSSTVIGTEEIDPAIQAERARTAGIAALLAKYPAGNRIASQALNEGWPTDKAELAMLRASRTSIPAISTGGNVREGDPTLIQAALLVRLGMESKAEKWLGAQAMEMSRPLHRMSMVDIARHSLEAAGREVPVGKDQLIQAALSAVALPVALGDAANKLLLDSYTESPQTWKSFAAIRPATDFKAHTAVRPSWVGGLEELPAGAEIKSASMEEATFSYSVDTFAKMLTIDRRDLVNDDLGLWDGTIRAFGKAGARAVADLVYGLILANASDFFHDDNGNLIGDPLSVAGLRAAITAMRVQRDDQNNDLDIQPRVLVVPPELEQMALALLNSMEIRPATASAGDEPTGNALRQAVGLQVESRLSNAAKFGSDASGTNWLLFGSPQDAAVVVAFLNNLEVPTTEYLGLQAVANKLQATWRVYHDFGAAFGDHRAAVLSTGDGA